jgi:uncharacterized 2Fe-2S/4Fe-4S cluster protein (DUF4445 family)
VLSAQSGAPLVDVLFPEGVEFPCGGQGRCKGCKVRVLDGVLPPTPEDRALLTEAELAQGWRLACRAQVRADLTLELAQWEAPILSDSTAFTFTPQPGWGIAIDLGTTTIVAQLLDLQTGRVLGVRTALNSQARFGADIMSRVQFALEGAGQEKLQSLVRGQLGQLVGELLSSAASESVFPLPCTGARPSPGAATSELQGAFPLPVGRVERGAYAASVQYGAQHNSPLPAPNQVTRLVLVGNTVMHHLFCGLSLEPLSHSPFEPRAPGLQSFSASELGWTIPGNPAVRFLPCLGSFVGSDLLAGVLATRLHEHDGLAALMDLGTNGEIVLGDRQRLLCASTAAGPAFEGARISMGMRAATGAIAQVRVKDGKLACHVLGNGPARGVCGSGLVDAVAAGLDLGWIQPSGRLTATGPLELTASITLTQADVRELQLAKGAIAAGLKILLRDWGAGPEDLDRIYLAGAFGNYISHPSARRIGLLPFPAEKVQPAGNTALLGAKIALVSRHDPDLEYLDLRGRTKHIPLNEDARFQEVFVREMAYPAAVT